MLYKRVLLKLSGEALMGQGTHGIDPAVALRLADEIHAVASQGTQLGLVIGGGNLLRGAGLAAQGMNRVSGDHMGMLATVMNALAMQDAIEKTGTDCRVMSALTIDQVCEPYSTRQAVRHLQQGRVVIFAAGTGNPFFTTDSAASLRAIEIGADIMLKATKVDGVYTADPMTSPDATLYKRISYDEALAQKLGVMDATALVLCSEHNMPLRVFNMFEAGQLGRIIDGQDIGTLVQQEKQE
ncbi:MAG: UMP kinase [Gammaproteobacteria bacterium]|nr:UMP kinase [Gammaproteobacteria bacterium]MDH3934039.1 UMP kinase [Gammaproteobacteria bacterium]MDH3970593.1 UMP kinase [Gammaproteobacteria bacterium]